MAFVKIAIHTIEQAQTSCPAFRTLAHQLRSGLQMADARLAQQISGLIANRPPA